MESVKTMSKSIETRLEKIEKALSIGEKSSVVFEYTDDNGVEQKIEMPSTDFDKLLQKIRAESKGLPVRERIAV
jgi:hypothetical protein